MTVLPEKELRALVARAVALEHEEAGRAFDAGTHSRSLGHISFERRQAQDSLSRIDEQLARAEATLAAHDRPMHGRGHRNAINEARADTRRLSWDRARLEKRLQDLDDEAERETHQLRAGDRSLKRAAHRTATEEVRTALDDDARVRGTHAAADPSSRLVAHLGDPPSGGPERDAWVEAAGRLAQHHVLFPIPSTQVLGSRPRAMGQDDYAHTHHAAQRAVEDLDRTLGRERAQGRQGRALVR